MLITKENYKIYAIDYLDGELDANMIAPMEQFLEQHPEIRAELEAMQDFMLEPDESVVYQHKAALKKPVRVVAWWQWSLLGVGLLVLIVGSALFLTKNIKSNKQELGKIEKVEKKSTEEYLKQEKEATQNFAITAEEAKNYKAEKALTNTQKPQAAPLPQQNHVTNVPTTPQVELVPNKQVNPVDQPAEKAPAPVSIDSIQLAPNVKVPTDSSKLLLPRDIKSLPMAVKDSRELHIQEKVLLGNQKLIVEAMAQVEQFKNQPIIQQRKKKIKTPFGNIKLGEIAESLIPESFVASKN